MGSCGSSDEKRQEVILNGLVGCGCVLYIMYMFIFNIRIYSDDECEKELLGRSRS